MASWIRDEELLSQPQSVYGEYREARNTGENIPFVATKSLDTNAPTFRPQAKL